MRLWVNLLNSVKIYLLLLIDNQTETFLIIFKQLFITKMTLQKDESINFAFNIKFTNGKTVNQKMTLKRNLTDNWKFLR